MSDTEDSYLLEEMYNLSGSLSDDNNDCDCNDWTPVPVAEMPISIDGVAERLLKVALEEVPILLMNVKRKLFGGRNRDMTKVPQGKFLDARLDPVMLGLMKGFINSNISSDPGSNSDITSFIRVEF